MLSPWRRLAGDGPTDINELTRPTTLYRGVAVVGMPDEQQGHITDLMDYDDWNGFDEGVLGKHLQAGQHVIQHLQDRQGGLGRHWTTDPHRAIDFAGRSMSRVNKDFDPRGRSFPAVLKTHWDGTGLDMTDKGMLAMGHNFKGDNERVLQRGHHVKVHGVWIPHGGFGDRDHGGFLESFNPDPDDPGFGHLHVPGRQHPGVI